MSHVLVRRKRQGSKISSRRRWDKITKCFFFFFVFFQMALSSSSEEAAPRHFVVSPPRKALVYGTASYGGAMRSDEDDIYGDDKRVVHTGPNPLHN